MGVGPDHLMSFGGAMHRALTKRKAMDQGPIVYTAMGTSADLAEARGHCEAQVAAQVAGLSLQRAFKIGITCCPEQRYELYRRSSQMRRMVVLQRCPSGAMARELERRLIASWRGHPSNTNVAPGGEGMSDGAEVAYVYIVLD